MEDNQIDYEVVLLDYLLYCKELSFDIGFTNGVFDILHAGHVTFIQECKKKCDVLIIGVNDDQSVINLKGPSRPIISINNRLLLLNELQSVDLAVPFQGTECSRLISIIKPKHYFKSNEYTKDTLNKDELDSLSQSNVKLHFLDWDRSLSTSKIVSRVILGAREFNK